MLLEFFQKKVTLNSVTLIKIVPATVFYHLEKKNHTKGMEKEAVTLRSKRKTGGKSIKPPTHTWRREEDEKKTAIAKKVVFLQTYRFVTTTYMARRKRIKHNDMNISIINIGDELLIGQVVNTNASTMSKMLIGAGMDVREIATIADDGKAIARTLRRLIADNDAVLVTGGLGPTKDDITKKTLCDFFGSELYENAEALANVKRIFDARGYELTEVNRQQAWVPRCCTMINNTVGTAPCMWFETKETTTTGASKVIVSMPGVPFEMVHLMEHEVVARLRAHFQCAHIINKNVLVQGIGESFLSDLIEGWELALPHSIRLAYLPQAGMVKLRLTARGNDEEELRREIADAVAQLYPIAGQYIVGEDLETLPELVADTLTRIGKTLATAESCTGGAIASKLTANAGASEYFKGGIVAYSNEVKEAALGVRHETLSAHGAVSEETVREMVEGARQRLHADYAIATTGIAGPGGGSVEKPVGTVWIAVASAQGIRTQKMKYGDRRAQTIERTCNAAYAMLGAMIKEEQQQ